VSPPAAAGEETELLEGDIEPFPDSHPEANSNMADPTRKLAAIASGKCRVGWGKVIGDHSWLIKIGIMTRMVV
jgi:hypothetical protein